MATITTNIDSARSFKDLDLNFTAHPIRKDINKFTNEYAVINSVKNLILTNHYERPFRPEHGSNIRRMLFENLDTVTAASIEREITQTILNFEPRVRIEQIIVTPRYDENAYSVQMTFSIINRTEPISINFLLERIR